MVNEKNLFKICLKNKVDFLFERDMIKSTKVEIQLLPFSKKK